MSLLANNMKSKTLNLIKHYHRLLEQDNQDMDLPADPSGDQDVAEAPQPEAESVPLSSPAEIRYIEDVVLAALMEPRPSGTDRITLENFLDLLKKPDASQRIQGSGKTAKDVYQTQILPIIRPAQEGQEIRNISDQMS